MENGEEFLRYPIGKAEKSTIFSRQFDDASKHDLLNDIKMLPAMLEVSLNNLDESQLQTPYRPGGWTVHQLIHHIADSHMNAYIRFKLGLTESNPTIKPYDEASWAELADTVVLPVNISMTLLHALHQRWYHLMLPMTDSEWQRTIYHPEQKRTFTLWEMLKVYSWHGLHHTAHITKLRERMNWN
jgi:hypothetical protein